MGDAVRRHDQSAAKRYRRRLRSATEQIAADDPMIRSKTPLKSCS
jgi:plasmid stabilization system protein ParE